MRPNAKWARDLGQISGNRAETSGARRVLTCSWESIETGGEQQETVISLGFLFSEADCSVSTWSARRRGRARRRVVVFTFSLMAASRRPRVETLNREGTGIDSQNIPPFLRCLLRTFPAHASSCITSRWPPSINISSCHRPLELKLICSYASEVYKKMFNH